VGSDREVAVDARVLAATNQDLATLVQTGKFREDLFYRLRVMLVEMPPLRHHREDIAFLAETFLQRHANTAKLGPRRFTHAALQSLEQYDWPGNVRQLSHAIERAVTLSDSASIDVDALGLEDLSLTSPRGAASEAAAGPASLPLPPEQGFNLEAITRHLLVHALEKTRGHKGHAAALLGVHPRTLTRMLRRFDLAEDDGRHDG
jgi:DNA-binding NtrC family response regulator